MFNRFCSNLQISVVFFITYLLFLPNLTFAQHTADKLTGEELASYEKQARQLVSFMEYAFNTIGSGKTAYQDKHTVIEQSYLKFFKDEKVQIEDDLVEKRDMVTQKNVQAYLKDIDFFFKDVSFKYTIEEVSQEINEAGELFFKIKASRNLKGTTLNGKEINENRVRYIEINLDKVSRDLKIVSVYTTKSNEVQELLAWWNSLDKGWRLFLAEDTRVADSVELKDVILIHNDYIVRALDKFAEDSTHQTDTIRINESKITPEIRRILRRDQIDISGVAGIYDIKPLYAFNGLKHLNISKAKVLDLEPIRNLSKLESLNASGALINNLEAVRYIPLLRILDVSGTLVSDIEPLTGYDNLEVLNISDSRVANIGMLKNLKTLKELYISNIIADQQHLDTIRALKYLTNLEVLTLSGLPIQNLTDLTGFENLKRLSLDNTAIVSLDGIQSLRNLEYLFIDNTSVSSLEPLQGLSNLKMVYCDKTNIKGQQALSFMQNNPGVKVIYESQELQAWWIELPEAWKQIFSLSVSLSDNPTREELHEISFIKQLDIAGNKQITDIKPISKLLSLNELTLSGTNITDVKPLADLFGLQILDLSSTSTSDLTPLSSLSGLKVLNLAHTKVTSIEPLIDLPYLRLLNIDSTAITNTNLIGRMQNMEMVFADGVASMQVNVSKIYDSLQATLIVYQTQFLNDWWNKLSSQWKSVFTGYEPFTETPDRVQLHKIATLHEISISRTSGVISLEPLSVLHRLEILNISGLQVTDLSPLSALSRLRTVDISNTPVKDITPLSNHSRITSLNCANTPLEDIEPAGSLKAMVMLDISGTQVSRLDALESCTALEELNCFNTRVNNLKPLDDLRKIKMLRAYNTRLNDRKISKFKELHPSAEVIYY